MKIEWNKVTSLSKILALILFIALPILGFWLGMKYGELKSITNATREYFITAKNNNSSLSQSVAIEDFNVQNDGIQPYSNRCLNQYEAVDFPGQQYISRRSIESPLFVLLKNKSSNAGISGFTINNVSQSFQQFDCDFYVVRSFNFDYKNYKALPNYSSELWRFNYFGGGEKVLKLWHGEGATNFSSEFEIDPSEKYIALGKGYSENTDYGIVIKSLDSGNDIVYLNFKNNPKLNGSETNLYGWSNDGKYLWGWGNIEGPYSVDYFIRIEVATGKVDILPAPSNATAGSLFNPNNGYVAYSTISQVTFDEESRQSYIEEAKKNPKKGYFSIYNVVTSKDIQIEETYDPFWNFSPKWLSDTQLQYMSQSSKQKVFTLSSQ